MFEVLDPLRTWFVPNPDFNESDAAQATRAQVERDAAIAGILDGSTPLDEATDRLAEQGLADEWIDATIENINYVIENDLGANLDPDETALWLPDSYWLQHLEKRSQEPEGVVLYLPDSYLRSQENGRAIS